MRVGMRMRVDAWKTRTRLLAVLAAVFAMGYVLILLSFGSEVELSKVEMVSPPPLALPNAGPERLTKIGDYASVTMRPLFFEDRRPRGFELTPGTRTDQVDDVQLTGVLITPTVQMATLQTSAGVSLRLKLNAPPKDGWKLLSIEPRAAMVERAGKVQSLQLKTFGGTVASTPMDRRASTQVQTSQSSSAVTKGLAAPTSTQGEPPRPPSASPILGAGTSSQERIEAIRQKIEARREQLRRQQQTRSVSPPNS